MLPLAALASLALVFALIGLEEVSWFQRITGVDTPAAFEDRGQPELNLHNSYTDVFENLYYVAAFVFIVLIPYLFAGRRLLAPFAGLSSVVPGRQVFYGAAVASAITYEMWEIIPIQLLFYLTIIALLTDPAPPGARSQSLLVVLVMIGVQGAFLAWGDEMARTWDDTELRELLIPFGFLVYGIGLRRTATPMDA